MVYRAIRMGTMPFNIRLFGHRRQLQQQIPNQLMTQIK
jgi:hypothetical protein